MRVLNAIQQQNKCLRAAFAGQNVVNVVVLFFCCDRDNALMIGGAGQARQLFARHRAQGNAGAAAKLRDLLHTRVTASWRNGYIIKTARPRRQSFFNGMNTKNNHQM